ncbi:flagellar basal body rod protein FlgB [Marinibactrum halimedae]|uniref:Flagellar basal body rod protein FlgB n=1 Tax=Marinibactrum halimedae TaxID=1444977 RepID=A0AA37WNE2_9GAMM|nr:flagellar basal body rod protein FlgB [Marinibactrum halimedae]MCD9458394.1 flagellar basal body rod protein FlgB [Marinibactrum halimedae]GLS26091.1 flagellar basal body rod protein FlgB [Marinibactrum halimedae]
MGISFDKALGVHERAFAVRAQRADVLANNIANAETPGFKARDIDFGKAMQQAMKPASTGLDMNNTNTRHYPGGAQMANTEELLYRNPLQPSIDGNTVDEHVEHVAYMENALDFQSTFTFLNSRFKGLITALRGD